MFAITEASADRSALDTGDLVDRLQLPWDVTEFELRVLAITTTP